MSYIFNIYDYESTGLNYMYDRPVQFAGIQADGDFNVIADPVNIMCRLPQDILMNPHAAIVHGLTPQELNGCGMSEPEFASKIQNFFGTKDSVHLGYNTEGFDKHITRHLFYRCLIGAYDYEWRNGCSRWDIQTLVRGLYAVARDAFQWPTNEDGKITFKLEKVCEANDIGNDNAHDALSDCRMTLNIAKLAFEAAPEWSQFFFEHRTKQAALKLLNLDQPLNKRFVVHSDFVYGKETCYVAPLVPICMSPSDASKVICVDLRGNVEELEKLSPEQITALLFSKEALPDGVERPPISLLALNNCPLLIPASHFNEDKFTINNLDRETCHSNFKKLLKYRDLQTKLESAFAAQKERVEEDVDGQLYFGEGFISKDDLAVIREARQQSKEALAKCTIYLQDKRMQELVFRYRARNLPETLNDSEKAKWDAHVKSSLTIGRYPISKYWDDLAVVTDNLSGVVSDKQKQIIHELRQYGTDIERLIQQLQND